ncbi:hypothetical protein [Haloplanus natans]|uniref:hypothetical protein n=1 Tax=Haloplanus natans TaxID=376171 RepID=UPI0012FB98CB|nr:hypothetical protein [Haloplanus natans]
MESEQSPGEMIRNLNDPDIRRDVLLFFVTPSIALVLIFLFPQSEQILEYKARSPTVLGIVGSNLAHRSVSHISNNIVGYWILGGAGYLLMRQSKSAHIYRYTFIAYLLVLPFFASWTILEIFADRPEVISRFESVGFSQTVGAVTGFLAIAIAYYHAEIVNGNKQLPISLGLFSLGFFVAFYNLGVLNNSIRLLAGVGIITLLYMAYRLKESVDALGSPPIVFLLGSAILYLYGLQLLFPPSAPAGIYGHMAGYVWGYLLPIAGIVGVEGYREARNRLSTQTSSADK